MDDPIIMFNGFAKLKIPDIIQRGLKTGSMNFPNQGLRQIPNEFLQLLPKPEEKQSDRENELEDEDDQEEMLPRNIDKEISSKKDLNIFRLNFSSNLFTCIPVVLCSVVNLQVLDFQDNQLKSLPPEIGLLTNLVRLILSHNQLTHFTTELYSLKKLRFIFAHDNKLCQLDSDINKLVNLECLDLSLNLLQEIPAELGYLKRLVRLNLAENRLSSLPEEIGCLESLQILDLTHNCISFLPRELGEIRSLEQLSIRKNQLNTFPLLNLCGSLKELHLGGNGIQEIQQDVLYPLVSLRVLELRDNRLQNIPDNISTLTNLVRLDLSNNNLDDLPGSMGLMSLQALTVEGNPLERIKKKPILLRGTEEILEYLRNRSEAKFNFEKQKQNISYEPLPSSKELNLEADITVEDKRMLQYSRTLNYCRRYIKEIPDEVFTLALPYRIHTMRLSNNRLMSVPTRIKDFLHLLLELDFSNNMLSELPTFLGYAPHLRVLDVQDNQLFVLPEEFIHLRQLQKLNISKNRFYQIPELLYEMHWLEMLFAGNNLITELDPTGLCKMKNLQVLDVCNNCIKSIPYQLGHMTQLRRLQLSGNPFRQPRPNVIARGTMYVMDWLRDRIPNQNQ